MMDPCLPVSPGDTERILANPRRHLNSLLILRIQCHHHQRWRGQPGMWGGWNCAECWAQQPRASPCPSNFPLTLMYTPHSCAPLGPIGVLSSRKATHQLYRPTVVSPSQSLGWSPVTSHSWTGLKYSSSLQCTGSQVQKMGRQGGAPFQAQSFPPCLLVSISFLFVCLFV